MGLEAKTPPSGLADPVEVVRRVVGDEWEDVVGSAVVAGLGAEDTETDKLDEGVLDAVGVAGVVAGVGEGLGEAPALVGRADGEQPGVARELARRWLDDERRAEKVQDLRPARWYTQRLPPPLRNEPGASTGETPPTCRSPRKWSGRLACSGPRPSGVADDRCHPHPVRHRARRPARRGAALAAGLR
jgi:hypothetical protein